MYIEHEIYAMEYLKSISILHETLFIINTMSKCDDYSTWGGGEIKCGGNKGEGDSGGGGGGVG